MKKLSKTPDWQNDPRLEAPIEDSHWDRQLSFASPRVLESLGSRGACGEKSGEFFSRDGYSHLKNMRINLGALDLTDRQLMAVSLVFYGGLKKNRAARAMKISSQALTDHLKAGLKKIGRSLG
jgi:DNA-directed RNA polymerase specialized sigma24 family protein